MSRPKGVRYTQDDFLQTIAHLKAHFGDRLAPQDQIVHYLDEHRELVSYRTMILRLGPKHQWLAILDGTLPFPEPKKSRKSQSDSQPEPAQSSETPEASALASEPKPEPQLEPQAEPAMAPIEENPVTNPQDETNQSQISIPLPAAAVSGKLKLEVELDERALTLRIIF